MKINYDEFSAQKCRELMRIQDEFTKEFALDQYANWFYDSDLELLRLYNDDQDEVYFKYIPVGTFSLKSRTWMWSWFNKYAFEPNSKSVLAIKEFGLKYGFGKLTEGTFDADEFDCWEFTAICYDQLKGIGAYKTTGDDLDSYMLITKPLASDSFEVVQFKQKIVKCCNHGLGRPAYVCQHLDLEVSKGFEEAFETVKGMQLDEDDDFQAWCSECEKVRLEHDGWNEQSEKFANIRLVCEDCYFELKNFNSSVERQLI